MIPIQEARELVLAHAAGNPSILRPVHRAVGCVLAERICSDMDSPPFSKSAVDGFAVRSADVPEPGTRLEVIERVMAGDVPRQPLRQGTATQVMTGAPLPAAADAVVMIEQAAESRVDARAWVRIEQRDVRAGQHVLPRGCAARRGELLYAPGWCLRSVDVGVLSEVGRTRVRVVRPPRVTVIATGNELVGAGVRPATGEIRNCNSPLLAALARHERADVRDLGICRDDAAVLRRTIRRGLQDDVLLLSGGVSVGVLDLVPDALCALQVRQVLHRVFLKPGKPFWFGVLDRDARRTLVFGLPGNPVGSLVCFRLFVRPALRRLRGLPDQPPVLTEARLGADYHQRSDRPAYVPAVARRGGDGQWIVTPVRWQGSADLRAIARANALAVFPPGECRHAAATEMKFLWLGVPDGETP